MKILCVDDEPTILRNLSRLLTFWGYTCIEAAGGEEALRILRGPDPPRLILLDWVMPGMDGLDVARRIRINPDAPFVYILFLTGKSLPTDLVTALDAGADEFVSKPFDPVELRSRLRVAERILGQVPSPRTASPRVDGYMFQDVLGEGAFGIVYRAIQKGTERPVAVKFLRVSMLGPNTRKQFMKEVRTAARLEHPNIARIYDFRSDGDQDYYAMELVDGPTLARVLESRELQRREAFRVLIKIGDALGHAHSQGIVHRDLKPSNILIAPNDEPKIVDFGLAKRWNSPDPDGSTLSRAEGLVGTPAFMAPEQAAMNDKAVGPPTDVYAMGVLAYRLLLRAYPYTIDRSLPGLLDDIAEGRIHSPRSIVPRLSTRIEQVLVKSLAKDPRNRYADGRAFAGAVRSLRDARR
jgi:serine/threonine protein kinase